MTQSAPSGTESGKAPSGRAAVRDWLQGPRFEDGPGEWSYRGERLGLPAVGAGALAPQGRRLCALAVDWLIALAIARGLGWHSNTAAGTWGPLAVFAAEQLILVSTLGFTIGKRLFGLRVGRLGGPLTPLNVIIRTVLLLLVIPAVVWDRDGRGLHDRLASTVVVQR